MAHPQASRTAFRCANPLAGGDASGLAEPDPRRLLEGVLALRALHRGPVAWLMGVFCT